MCVFPIAIRNRRQGAAIRHISPNGNVLFQSLDEVRAARLYIRDGLLDMTRDAFRFPGDEGAVKRLERCANRRCFSDDLCCQPDCGRFERLLARLCEHDAQGRHEARGSRIGCNLFEPPFARTIVTAVETGDGAHQRLPRSKGTLVRDFCKGEGVIRHRPSGDCPEGLLEFCRSQAKRMGGRQHRRLR